MTPQTPLNCFIGICQSVSDWKDIVSIIGTIVTVPGILFAAYKTWREVQRMREQRHIDEMNRQEAATRTAQQQRETLEQRQREHELRRIEFTLTQHRRLFDDPALFSVLRYLDGNPEELRDRKLTQSKRKFLTFFEEIALLSNSNYIQKEVAFYMFGYYAVCAHKGSNFRHDLEYTPKHWGLFMKFAEEADQYLETTAALAAPTLRL